jgi:exosortase
MEAQRPNDPAPLRQCAASPAPGAAQQLAGPPAKQEAPTNIGFLAEFQDELIEAWQRLPNKLFFLVLLAAWLALFHILGNSILGYVKTNSLFLWLGHAYRSLEDGNDDAHGKFVPLLVLGLFWWKRHELLALNLRIWLPGLAILAGAMLLHVLGYLVQQPMVSVGAMFLGVYAVMGLAWGPEWLRRSLFPFLLFLFAIPLGQRAEMITFTLRLMVTQIVEFICHSLLSLEVARQGNTLSHVDLLNPANNYQYEVAAACSGIRSLVAIGLMATVCAFVFFRTWWKRVILLASAVPLAVAGNVLRLLAIVVAAEIGGRPWGDYVHESSFFSLLPYVPAILALIWVVNRLEEKKDSTRA